MNSISIVFAYVAGAYLVASKISTLQIYAVSAIYSLFLTFPMLSAFIGLRRISNIAVNFASEHPEVASQYIDTGGTLNFFPVGIIVVVVLGWLLSIAFMLQVRKRAID